MQWQRHPQNRSFRWPDAQVRPRWISAAQAESWNARGFFVLEDAFDAGTIASVIDAIAPLEAEQERWLQQQPDGRHGISQADGINFRAHLVAQDAGLRAFSLHPVFAHLCRDLLGDDVRLYWDQSVYKKPGMQEEFPWHQDNGYTYTEPQVYLTCWVALSEATEDNGCPWVLPGLHLQGTLRHRLTPVGFDCFAEGSQVEGAESVPLRSGSIAVFSSLTPHRTGPNLTDTVRKSYILQYARDGAKVFPHRRGSGQPEAGEPFLANAPERQYPILIDGIAQSA